jgi:glycosyltransferase involved in cell wall biosynthesis
MRIGLNLLFATPEIGGSWNYVSSLVKGIEECDSVNTYVAYVTKKSVSMVAENRRFVQVLVNIDPIVRTNRVIYENTVLQVLARKHKLDCMHWFANTQAIVNTVPGVVTVYDLQTFSKMHNWPIVKRIYLKWMMSYSVRSASLLLPMSYATAQDLERVLQADPSRMTVIHPVLGKHFVRGTEKIISSFRTKYRLPCRFWVYVAHLYPHKNHRRLLEAFGILRKNGFPAWPLVLRGDGSESDSVRRAIREFQLEDQVTFLPRLEVQELPFLYSTATALVYPSLYEGGGIPVIEALACGCPVLAADIPPTREYADSAASYFDPHSTPAIVRAISEFQSDPRLRENLREEGFARAEMFRSEQVISKLLEAYVKAIGG